MKYWPLFFILINFSIFGQAKNQEVDSKTVVTSKTESDPFEDINIVMDSIESFKKKSDNKEIIEPEYSLQRERLKKNYIEKGILIQKQYAEMKSIEDELPEQLRLKVKNIESTVFDILPNGNLPDDLREKLGYIKLISTYYKESGSIDKTLKFIKEENKKGIQSNFYTSVNGINEFGYELMNTNKKEESLKVFNLNVALYPENANVYDSLGECLLALNKKENAIKAYKTSLKLDPNNENAKKIIIQNQ